MKEYKQIICFKCVLIIMAILFVWVACDIIDSYDIEWPAYNKFIEDSKMRFDQNGNRLNRQGWE